MAMNRDEIADAAFGSERGIVSFELSVVIGKPIHVDHVAEVVTRAEQPSRRGPWRRRPVAAVKHPQPGLWTSDGTELPVLVDVDAKRRVRGWSRHGTDLTARLGSLLAPFETVAPGTTFDGELVAIGERGGQPTQDFAAVTRAVFTGKPLATDRLRLVVFDLLCCGG